MFKISPNNVIYLFIDEGGNLDFSKSGTRYFTMTCLYTSKPYLFDKLLSRLRFKYLEKGLDLKMFHASEDSQERRNHVFSIIRDFRSYKLFSIVVEKENTPVDIRNTHSFYPDVLGELINLVIKSFGSRRISKLIIITDRLPIKKKKDAFSSAIKTTIKKNLEKKNVVFHIYHQDSMSSYGLQAADYCNWALFRFREREDIRSMKLLNKIDWEILDNK